MAKKIAPHLGATADSLLLLSALPRIIRPSGPKRSEVEKAGEGWPDVGEEYMDLLGVAEGGADGSFALGEVIDHIRRPLGPRKARDVAALNVIGESMVPRFRPGN